VRRGSPGNRRSRAGAGLIPKGKIGGPRGFGDGAAAAPDVPGPSGSNREEPGETRRGRSARCAPRVDDTAEALFATRKCSLSSRRGEADGAEPTGGNTGGPRGPGRRCARTRRETSRRAGPRGPRECADERRCLGPVGSQEPFTRLGGSGLGPRDDPRSLRAVRKYDGARPRADAGGRSSAGKARGATRHQRYAGKAATGEDNAPDRRPVRRSGLDGVNRELPQRVGTALWRASRLGQHP
jgi:hypothetical protein